ncbi:quinolinate synthase [Methanohalophilus levihalophilus]|uniref:quinolinate synthase NadA n=1 Tax=Methanohalophilus levihalophilus TaxID=1431282 RepID=UPI001AE1D954|nr:quinolinate synthase NadA [Methanohalophilus levihalophilus]MBP2029566.1 quinolinate synthase [Methanohalophilus levihalophilus]
MQPIAEQIQDLKEELNAVILAHNYQRCEIQQMADFVGDSLGLSQQAVKQDADVIVFCGVDFMAESAAILSPDKTVLLPVKEAHCPMSAMAEAPALREAKAKHPDAAVVCYVNSSAAVKAESDICCTSSNAVEVVNSLDADEILFVPDMNLGNYVSRFTDKKIITWEGHCPVHHQMVAEDILLAKHEHPDAEVLVHPECRAEVIDLADAALSTSGILKHVSESSSLEFIIGTENGMLCGLEAQNPDKMFYIASPFAVCVNMKMITPSILLESMEEMKHVVTVPEDLRTKAKLALDRMLAVV